MADTILVASWAKSVSQIWDFLFLEPTQSPNPPEFHISGKF